jgi:hypothetical protein
LKGITRELCMQRFETDRCHLSHDLFLNGFIGLLQPGYDERLSERDIVLNAARGERASIAAIEPALAAWRSSILPALEKLINTIATNYGFETSKRWQKDINKVRKASIALSLFQPPLQDTTSAEVIARVKRFWDACDIVRDFLAALRSSFSLYFFSWKPDLLIIKG